MVFRAEHIYRSLIILFGILTSSHDGRSCDGLPVCTTILPGNPLEIWVLSRVLLAETKPESENDSVEF